MEYSEEEKVTAVVTRTNGTVERLPVTLTRSTWSAYVCLEPPVTLYEGDVLGLEFKSSRVP
jgi:hypothetical protein